MSQAQLISPTSPTVSLINGRTATTSLEVAKFFGKRHDAVLRDIRNLTDNCPEEFTAHNFVVSEYVDETGRTLATFILYRDGFMLLVMGYTGKKAMQIKLAYIMAFNAMEESLDKLAAEERAQVAGNVKALPQTTTRSTAADRAPLRALVHAWSQVAGVGHAALWPQVKAHFQLSRIDDLPVEWLPDALAFVQGKIDGYGPQKALPAAEQAALPCAKPALDPAVYLKGKRIFDMMSKLMTDFDLVKTHVMLWGRPGARLARLSPEQESLYQNAVDASKMALCSLNQAQYALRIAMQIQVAHSFDRR